MKCISASIMFALTFYTQILPQFSIEKFIDEPLTNTYLKVKENLANKKIIEKEMMNNKAIVFYDWMEPLSIKAGYIFNTEGKQNGKIIANGNTKIEDARTLFKQLKEILIKKYGSDYSENSLSGWIMLVWKGIDGFIVMLTSKEDNTMLTIMRN